MNRKIEERLRGQVPTAQVDALRAEAAQLDREVQNLVQALAHGTAYEAISAALAAKDLRLKAVRTQLDVLTRRVPDVTSFPRVEAQGVRDRLGAIWEDIRKLDGDRARMAFAQVFDGITVKPLRGSWENGWTLEMRTRPQVGFPEGAVVSSVGCGGRIQHFLETTPKGIGVRYRGRIFRNRVVRDLRRRLVAGLPAAEGACSPERCSFPGCNRPNHAHGLCDGHRNQLRRGVALSTLQPPRRRPRKLSEA